MHTVCLVLVALAWSYQLELPSWSYQLELPCNQLAVWDLGPGRSPACHLATSVSSHTAGGL